MKESKLAKTICCSFALGLLLLPASPVRAQESFRISRPKADETPQPTPSYSKPIQPSSPPMASEEVQATVPSASSAEPAPRNALQANATLNLEERTAPLYQNAIVDWQNRNLPQLDARNGATTDGGLNNHHRGLKAHVGGAFSSVLGSVASAYVPMAHVPLRSVPTNSEPTISIEPGHCPAAFDPAFQVPVKWWDSLSREEGSPTLGPQWKLWLTAVRYVFQAHAADLHETPGVASLHVMVNPDGSIYNITPYNGAERGNAGYAVNGRTLANLRQILINVGKFPPFPAGSQVRCYHLIFNGSAGN